MLSGIYRHTLDEKNRVRIPSKYKDAFCSVMYVAPGRTGCLYLFPGEDQLRKYASKFINEDVYSDDEMNDISTAFWSAVDEIKEDQQGRILIRDDVKKIAGISKDIVFVGRLDFVEVWPADVYDRKQGPLNPERISNMLAQLKNRGN
ncbi:MAG: hypothetical protein MJ068_01525 [Clostridia bacterium]|nr:hypothetical protein [Clostridia bacterium]